MENEHEKALTPTELAQAVEKTRKMIARGDYSAVEAQLITQATALNGIFETYLQKMITSKYIGAQEIFGNLALKAQNQSLKTLRILTELKNPKMNTFI